MSRRNVAARHRNTGASLAAISGDSIVAGVISPLARFAARMTRGAAPRDVLRRAAVWLLAFAVLCQASLGVALAMEAANDPLAGMDFGICTSRHDVTPDAKADLAKSCPQCVACVFVHAAPPVATGAVIPAPIVEGRDVFLPHHADEARGFFFPGDFDAQAPPTV
jgi:hypothetical protein